MAIVRTRTLGLFVLAALVLVAMLAVALVDSRAQARGELEDNFAARATIAAALIESTLQAAAVTQGQQDRLAVAGPRVTSAQVARAAASLPGQTKIVTDSRGRVLAAHPPTAARVGSDARDRGPHVRAALGGRTSLAALPRGGRPRLELAFALTRRMGGACRSPSIRSRSSTASSAAICGGSWRAAPTRRTSSTCGVRSSRAPGRPATPVARWTSTARTATSTALGRSRCSRRRWCRAPTCASCC